MNSGSLLCLSTLNRLVSSRLLRLSSILASYQCDNDDIFFLFIFYCPTNRPPNRRAGVANSSQKACDNCLDTVRYLVDRLHEM